MESLVSSKIYKLPLVDSKINHYYNPPEPLCTHTNGNTVDKDICVKRTETEDYLIYRPRKRNKRVTISGLNKPTNDERLNNADMILEDMKRYEESIDNVVYSWYEASLLTPYEPTMRNIIKCNDKLQVKDGIIRCKRCNPVKVNDNNDLGDGPRIIVECRRRYKKELERDEKKLEDRELPDELMIGYNPRLIDYFNGIKDSRPNIVSSTNLYHLNRKVIQYKTITLDDGSTTTTECSEGEASEDSETDSKEGKRDKEHLLHTEILGSLSIPSGDSLFISQKLPEVTTLKRMSTSGDVSTSNIKSPEESIVKDTGNLQSITNVTDKLIGKIKSSNTKYIINASFIWDPYTSDNLINVTEFNKLIRIIYSSIIGECNNESLNYLMTEYASWYKGMNFLNLLGDNGYKTLTDYRNIDKITSQIERVLDKNYSKLLICKALQSVSTNLFLKDLDTIDLTLEEKLDFIDGKDMYYRSVFMGDDNSSEEPTSDDSFNTDNLICNSIVRRSPSILDEFIKYGGTPVTTVDMELGIWSRMTPFSSCTVSDIPVIYSQQIQYMSKKHLSLVDNKALIKSRVFNSFLDSVLTIGNEESFTDEEMEEISQNTKYLPKGHARSKYKFAEPYADIDLILHDKETLDRIKPIINAIYQQTKDKAYIAATNGYYYYENGILVENEQTLHLRNSLFTIECSSTRSAWLTEILNDYKRINSVTKPAFLSKSKQVFVGKSKIHGYGLFAAEPIPKGEIIMEYAGVIINDYIADKWEENYDKIMGGSTYLFRLDQNYIIDATMYGNSARFINHSCNPNTATLNFSCIEDDGYGTHVGVYASKDIMPGDELFYNYRLSDSSNAKESCFCGSDSCKGYMSIIK